jgi:hypothetical protein
MPDVRCPRCGGPASFDYPPPRLIGPRLATLPRYAMYSCVTVLLLVGLYLADTGLFLVAAAMLVALVLYIAVSALYAKVAKYTHPRSGLYSKYRARSARIEYGALCANCSEFGVTG